MWAFMRALRVCGYVWARGRGCVAACRAFIHGSQSLIYGSESLISCVLFFSCQHALCCQGGWACVVGVLAFIRRSHDLSGTYCGSKRAVSTQL
jgi:hypothetical protein